MPYVVAYVVPDVMGQPRLCAILTTFLGVHTEGNYWFPHEFQSRLTAQNTSASALTLLLRRSIDQDASIGSWKKDCISTHGRRNELRESVASGSTVVVPNFAQRQSVERTQDSQQLIFWARDGGEQNP